MKMHAMLRTAVTVTVALALTTAMPYRSTQGVLRNRASLNDFLTTYLQAVQQRAEPQYGYLEYQPSYQQGFIAHRPRRISQRAEPFVQYLRSTNIQPDYQSYDYPETTDETYDGMWYDEAPSTVIGSPSFVPQTPAVSDMLENEPTEQDLALAQLMLDHIAGKYSLEDLETLEREARMEENTEHQLRALTKKVHRKKSLALPFMSDNQRVRSSALSSPQNAGISKSRTTARLVASAHPSVVSMHSIGQRRGQKEEPVMVPATSVRRPVFVQHLEEEKNTKDSAFGSGLHQQELVEKKSLNSAPLAQSLASSTSGPVEAMAKSDKSLTSKPSSPVLDTPAGSPRTSGVVEVVKVGTKSALPNASGAEDGTGSTMAPYVQSAYEALKHYLETERKARMDADQESFKSIQKRFIQESDPLARQLNALKKTIA
ncbi:uncharacterized protein LOC108679867 [Hyalella azteca]|uniref:Uncharacterized protein LOC108679867 n=1 Tax=Hyalella azteca TaxID=294128 RepID=A0A8B7PFK5_HYAAZ|nr:uncharacterized protein LOC108679867 [Hyalella azteca]